MQSATVLNSREFEKTLITKIKNDVPLSGKEITKILELQYRRDPEPWTTWNLFHALLHAKVEKNNMEGYDQESIVFAAGEIALILMRPKIVQLHTKHENKRIRSNVDEDFRSECYMAIINALRNYDPEKSKFANHVKPYLEQVGLTFEKDQSNYMQKRYPVNVISADAKAAEDDSNSQGTERMRADYDLEKDVEDRENRAKLKATVFIANSKKFLTKPELKKKEEVEALIEKYDRANSIISGLVKAEKEADIADGSIVKKLMQKHEMNEKKLEQAIEKRNEELHKNAVVYAKFLGGFDIMPEELRKSMLLDANDCDYEEEYAR